FGNLMESSSTLFEISIPRGALENNKIMYLLKKTTLLPYHTEQHGSISPLDNMKSHCVLYRSSDILHTGQDLTFLNTCKNI
ncbi:hypothetical protein N340_12127, partial [Tauraco erythrolophus]